PRLGGRLRARLRGDRARRGDARPGAGAARRRPLRGDTPRGRRLLRRPQGQRGHPRRLRTVVHAHAAAPGAGGAERRGARPGGIVSAVELTLRRSTPTTWVGRVPIGSGHPVVVQSMTNTSTADAEATARQVYDLWRAGSEIVRVTVNDAAAAQARSEEHTSELQSRENLVCRLLL